MGRRLNKLYVCKSLNVFFASHAPFADRYIDFLTKYSKSTVDRTLMARLPRLFRISYIFGKIKGDFRFYIDNGILCVLI